MPKLNSITRRPTKPLFALVRLRELVGCVLTLLLLVGCQSVAPPAAGKATLRISVIAEPKAGVVTGNTHVLSYDAPGASPTATGQFALVDYASLDDIVVWLEPADSAIKQVPSKSTAILEVNAAKPNPGLCCACVGQQIMFANGGVTAIDLYSVSDGNEFDLGMIPAGQNKAYLVKSAGLIEVLTDSVKDPICTIYAAPTSMVKLSHAGGSVEFGDVVPGEYKLVSWHPRLPGQQINVVLSPNRVTELSIKVGVNSLPKLENR